MSGYYPPPGPPPQQFGGYPQQPPQGGPGWGQQQFGGPPQQYQQPPQQQQWMPPPGPPPAGQQFQHMPPPQQGYNSQGPPMQQNFHQPPQQGFQQRPISPLPPQVAQGGLPSPGYGNEVAQGNAGPDIDALNKAMSGFKKDHATVIRILTKQSPAEMALLRQTYAQRNGGASLESKVESSFRSHYGDALLQLVQGPLIADVWNVHRSIKGLGTREDMLNDVLIGRSNADMRAIKATYQQIFHKSMESDVTGDLSLKTEAMFQLIMRASRTEESYPYNPTEVSRDVETIQAAVRGVTTNQEPVYTVLTQRSNNQIRAIAHEYQNKYKRTLEETVASNFSGHMRDALVLCVGRATDRAKFDAHGLEDTMKGLGTKDNLLVMKVVRIHWDPQQKDQAKRAYQHFFKRDLIERVRGETSGDYRTALVACLS